MAPFNIMEELESLVDMFAVQLLGSSVDVMLDLATSNTVYRTFSK